MAFDGSWLRGRRPRGQLPLDFFARDTRAAARGLLGKVLVSRADPRYPLDDPRAGVAAGRIVECEAYRGADPASHSARGRTPRCAVMFEEPGRAYVYFIYGMHEMLNFVCEPRGRPGAVLIRALEPLWGKPLMARRRGTSLERGWANGPGKLCSALGVRLSHNGQRLDGPALFVVDDGAPARPALASPRVGVTAGRQAYWRYFLAGHHCVSRAPQNAQARGIA